MLVSSCPDLNKMIYPTMLCMFIILEKYCKLNQRKKIHAARCLNFFKLVQRFSFYSVASYIQTPVN